MRHKLFHCWDCGQRVIKNDAAGKLAPEPCLQQIKFGLSDGSYMVNPFCADCATRAWTPERMESFRQAIVEVMPSFNRRIVKFEGEVSLIPGVVR